MEYGCIGRKLAHSFSKTIHNMLTDYDYELSELEPSQLADFMEKRDFRAINVTIPYKQDVIPYLYSISDRAKSIGAVNTVVNRDGRLYGYNTDFSGMQALLSHAGIEVSGKKTAVLGSGGTSKTAFAVAKSLGASEILRVSRTEGNGCIDYDTLCREHADTEVIINTTPVGMYPDIGKSAVDISCFPKLSGVADAVYNPLRPELVMCALENGIPASGGLYMLVAQAVFAAEKFLDCGFDRAVIDDIYTRLLLQKENIVLVGMPGCGKSSIGRCIARLTSRRFIDTDDEIVKREGRPIPEIFSAVGEKGFRDIESGIIKKVSAEGNAVIATGGGAVLRAGNVRLLKQNGRLFFIDRHPDDIAVTSDRPLSDDREKLIRLYDARLPVYRACSDVTVKAVDGISINAQTIIKEYGL